MSANQEALVRDVIAERLQDRFLFVYEHEAWLKWDGVRWAPTPRIEVRNEIGDWAHTRWLEAPEGKVKDSAASACSYDSQEALTNLAEGHLLKFAADFDSNPLWLNCQNGTVNLATGELTAHDPNQLLTRVAAVNFVPGYRHPDFDKALRALPEELHEWMQLRFGQAITGLQPEDEHIIYLVGTGENGKSALLDTFRAALGEKSERGYSLMAHRSILSAGTTTPGGINSALASLEGMRFVTIEELADGHFLSSTAIKDVVGTAKISARHPYERQNEFDNTATIFVTSNHDPALTDTDDGLWRRNILVRFPFKFAVTDNPTERHKEPDRTLKARLREGVEQREAALAWLVAGAVAYFSDEGHKRFLDVPRLVEASTKGWRAEADLVMLYIETFLIFDPRRAVRPDDLRCHFNQWASDLGHKELSAQKFNGRFANHTLITSRAVERDKVMKTNALAKVISYPPGADHLGSAVKTHKVWSGFRFRRSG